MNDAAGLYEALGTLFWEGTAGEHRFMTLGSIFSFGSFGSICKPWRRKKFFIVIGLLGGI